MHKTLIQLGSCSIWQKTDFSLKKKKVFFLYFSLFFSVSKIRVPYSYKNDRLLTIDLIKNFDFNTYFMSTSSLFSLYSFRNTARTWIIYHKQTLIYFFKRGISYKQDRDHKSLAPLSCLCKIFFSREYTSLLLNIGKLIKISMSHLRFVKDKWKMLNKLNCQMLVNVNFVNSPLVRDDKIICTWYTIHMHII